MTTLNSLKLKVQMSEIQEPENTFLSHRKGNLIEPVHETLLSNQAHENAQIH